MVIKYICSQLLLYRSRRYPYYVFDITEFSYKVGHFNGSVVLRENDHFDISGYFVISKFDIEGVHSIEVQNMVLYLYLCIKLLYS